VVSLDKLDEHVGETGGEPGIVYIKGDLTDPRALAFINQFITDSEMQTESRTIIDILERVVVSEYAVTRVATVTGKEITDSDGDGLPDSQAQVEAAYAYMLTEGVHLDENTLVYTPGQIREVLFHDPRSDQEDVTILTIGIPGTREQQNVVRARDILTNNLEVIRESPAVTYVGLTGSPFTRLAQLDASTTTLQRSLPIAAVASLVLLLIVMRSFRYAVVTIIPIGLVVAWLYGLMYMIGFPLNYVTATIGAVSLGVGIDYSIHVTERFREEMRRVPNKMQALRQAANGTGVALLASAISSIVGFAIMGFAPMPMFSTYGILTAVMIFLAMLASLVVLPSLLLMVTREKTVKKTQDKSDVAWNLAVGLLYKSQKGHPWKLAEFELDTCYAGISFYKERTTRASKAAMAQVFLDSGESFILLQSLSISNASCFLCSYSPRRKLQDSKFSHL